MFDYDWLEVIETPQKSSARVMVVYTHETLQRQFKYCHTNQLYF